MSCMKSRLFICMVLLAWLGFEDAAHAQAAKSSGASMDDLIDWSDPLALTQQKLISFLDTHRKDRSKPAGYNVRTGPFGTQVMVLPASNGLFEDTVFGGFFEVDRMMVIFSSTQSSISLTLSSKNVTKKKLAALDVLLAQKTGDSNPDEDPGAPIVRKGRHWVHPKYMVRYNVGPSSMSLLIQSPLDSRPPPPEPAVEIQPVELPNLSADLDALLNFNALWLWTPAEMEKAYVLKTDDKGEQPKPPQFEWMSASKDRARFSRHMFSNIETKLTMFGGSINVEEVILEFVNGKAARATISFYNRGDSGDITTAEFDRIFKLIGQNLGQVMKVSPKRQILSSNAALPVTGWNWTSPGGIALLEYNEYNTPGKVTKPEFLRLKLAAPNQADWSMGKMATGVQRMELLQRIKKTPEGDVYISGVPMVDQGQKGYCVAASCQRLFEYMRIPCDQHEMAKLVSIDAGSGADITTMQKSLAKIDGAFNVTFKPLINPEQYYTNGRKRRVSEKAFFSIVKEYTDKGVPLLWGLFLGEKPEDPPLPGGGQVSGGHMRMIIGYNLAKNQILFTDSWGAGHELKRMAMLDAYDVTLGLYSMAPRGF